MSKFLKSVRTSSSKKDQVIKKAITASLSNSIKEIQYAAVEGKRPNKVMNITEAANELSLIMEAMFLHGLRDSLTHRFQKALAGIDEKPQAPDFWAPILIISHRQIIDQISNLTQITTQVGQCRAWIRLALNECLLSSYIQAVRQDASALKSYYNANAYLRDSDLLEVAQRLIEGVESSGAFTLPTNSSLLNNWQTQSLVMAGIWSPTLKNTPIAPCDDVAMIIDEDIKQMSQDEVSDTASLCSAMSLASQMSGKQGLPFSEDDVIKVILAKDCTSDLPCSTSNSSSDIEVAKNCIEDSLNHNIGNSLNREGWSFDESCQTEHKESTIEEEVVEGERDPGDTIEGRKSMESSFTALVESYNMFGGNYIRTPDIRGMWQKFEDRKFDELSPSPTESTGELSLLNSISNASQVRSESTSMSAQVFRIACEKGLDVQNFQCAGCKASFEVNQMPCVCHYTGEYFCRDCMNPEEITIPARIIHNWDFKTYPVSLKSANYINEIKYNPVIDFKVLNPYIYSVSEEMAELQTLRNQLNLLRAYLYTCREPIIVQLQKQMWPREYMYEHIHQYSISDLQEVQNNVLAQQLYKVIKFGIDHVFNCWLCSQKGFVCEICNNPKALFPFDIENVFRCEVCNAVYHKTCLNSTQPCRKCERRKRREELVIDGAICVDELVT